MNSWERGASTPKLNSEKKLQPSQTRPSDETITSNDEADVIRSLEFLKNVLESQYVRGDKVGLKNLFLHISKAPPELQKCCGKDIKEFKKMLSKFPETFVVKNNYVCLNIFKDGQMCSNRDVIENLVAAQKAVDEISQHKEMGLKVQGPLWGMTGNVSLITVTVLPTSKMYIFDMVQCPTSLSGTNLGSLLESEEIVKVVHNCQNDAATLLGNHGIQLRNVFDTQCAFKTIQYTNPQMLDDNMCVHYLNLYNLLDYYELGGDELVKKEEGVKKALKKNPDLWTQRPLRQYLMEYAVACAAPLLVLYNKMKEDRALKVNQVLFQNLVYEECMRFAIPLIIKRRQNVRQTSLRSWKRQMANERRYISYCERSNSKDQIWKNDYHVVPHVQVNQSRPGCRSSRSNEFPRSIIAQDLDTKYFMANKKRYYFDIKEQNGVKFVKISEIACVDRTRNLISINLSLVARFRNVLIGMQNLVKPMVRKNTRSRGTDLVLSQSITKDTRRYLIDLKRNYRGYFVTISQMLPTGGKLSSVAFDIQDIATFIEILNDIGEEFGVDESVVEGNYMRFRNKRYFFNVNHNDRGTFMKISEIVSPNYQSSMTIAEKSWDDFVKKLSETIESYRKSKPAVENDKPAKKTDEK